MHISAFEYRIRDIDEEFAPAFAAVPGLLSKLCLHGERVVRGGV